MIDEVEACEVWSVPIPDLLPHYDPFNAWVEPCITVEEVRDALRDGHLDDRPFSTIKSFELKTEEAERAYHIGRIAWLIAHPAHEPIEIDIGMPHSGQHPRAGIFDFIDGNHRLCAAIVRGLSHISVTYSGECDAFPELFPRAVLIP